MSRLTKRGVSRSSRSRGGMRWTRQRQARRVRRQGMPWLLVRRAWPRHLWSRLTRSADDDAVRCGPGRRCAPLTSPLRAGPNRVVPMPRAGIKGRSNRMPTGARKSLVPTVTQPKAIDRRGEHEASRKNHRVRNAGRIRCFRGDYARVYLTHITHEAADASRVRRSVRPRFWAEGLMPARMGQAPCAQGRNNTTARPRLK